MTLLEWTWVIPIIIVALVIIEALVYFATRYIKRDLIKWINRR